jgi:phage-related protein
MYLLWYVYVADEDKRLVATFYKTALGAEPVRTWLLGLTKEDRFLIGTDIKTVEYGWPVGMPTCRPLRAGLFEVRTNLPRNRLARVLFSATKDRMFLLHGFIKKQRTTSKADLELALERKRSLEKQ